MQAGDQIGKFLLLHEREGLWLAERIEDFPQQVCIEAGHLPDDNAAQEAVRERRARYASLEHPAIPRHLHHEINADQQLVIVTDFVLCKPVAQYAAQKQFTTDQRIEVVLACLDALAYAHSRLLAHGLLHGESFCITAEGQVRLPAFQVLSAADDGVARDLAAAMESLHASLAGVAKLPSELRRILIAADTGRYTSLHALSQDLRHFLRREPLSVHAPTLSYRTALFARRNPAIFFPAVLVALVVLAATIYSAAMYAAARHSRTLAQVRLRLQQMVRLTYALESDLYDPLSKVPGSDKERRTLIHWTAESLDSVAAQAGNDAALRQQLAEAYAHLAVVERNNQQVDDARDAEAKAQKLMAATRD